ncbi:MAG: type 4a pilus biogenesis protein PilO [bacterium]|nr:type 4a pilus biogenesis protein PilO [bacterium]
MNSYRTYIGATLVAIAGIIFWTMLVPAYDDILIKRDAITERTDIIKARSDILSNIKALSLEYSNKATDITRFASMVPEKKGVPELLSSIQALATQNGLQLTTIALSENSNPGAADYQTQSIDLGLNGGYLAFKSFLMALERNIRLIDIISISASPTSEDSPIINFSIKGNAYYLKQ